MKHAILASGLILLGLAGCNSSDQQQTAATAIPSKPKDDTATKVTALNPKELNVVLYRAISDVGLNCQSVASSAEHKPVQGYPAWTAHCEGGENWVVILQSGGVMQVMAPQQLGESDDETGANETTMTNALGL